MYDCLDRYDDEVILDLNKLDTTVLDTAIDESTLPENGIQISSGMYSYPSNRYASLRQYLKALHAK